MTGAPSEDLIEEFLATSGKYPGLAEFLDEQRSADDPPQQRPAQSDEAPQQDLDDDQLSPYPSTVVNAGGIPASWGSQVVHALGSTPQTGLTATSRPPSHTKPDQTV